jgi:hypothetical protein
VVDRDGKGLLQQDVAMTSPPWPSSTGVCAGSGSGYRSRSNVLLQLLDTQLADYDDAISAAVAEHPDASIFTSLPGVGPVLTALPLAEIG